MGEPRTQNVRALVTAIIAVVIVWAILHLDDDADNVIDMTGLFVLTIASLLAVATMLARTRDWTVRSVSVFLLFLGIGISTGSSFVSLTITDGGRNDMLSDLARSLLLVGGPLLVVAFFWYLVKRDSDASNH